MSELVTVTEGSIAVAITIDTSQINVAVTVATTDVNIAVTVGSTDVTVTVTSSTINVVLTEGNINVAVTVGDTNINITVSEITLNGSRFSQITFTGDGTQMNISTNTGETIKENSQIVIVQGIVFFPTEDYTVDGDSAGITFNQTIPIGRKGILMYAQDGT